MDFKDIGRVWREEDTGEFRRIRVEDLSTVRRRAARHLNTMARRGYRYGGVLLLIVVPLFTWAVIVASRPLWAAPGAALLWGWLIYLVVFWRRLGMSEPDPTLPVREAVAVELERLRAVERFRETLGWSLGAFVVGEILFFAGLTRGLAEDSISILVFSAVVLAIAGLGIRGNRRILSRTIRPLRTELESWLGDLEKLDLEGGSIERENEVGGLDGSNLRNGDLKGGTK